MNIDNIVLIVIVASLLIFTLVRSGYVRKKDLQIIDEIRKAKNVLTRSIFYHLDSEIPNYKLFGHKMLKVDREYAVYHLSLIKIGRTGIFQTIDNNIDALTVLFREINEATKPFSLALKDSEFLVMAFVSHSGKVNHEEAKQKQIEILNQLPKEISVKNKTILLDYAISSLSLTGDSSIYGISKVERRLTFAMKYALENENGFAYHCEEIYREEMMKKHLLRSLTNSLKVRRKNFYVMFQPIFRQDDLRNPIKFEALIRWRNSKNIGPQTFIPLLQDQPKLQCDLTKILLDEVGSALLSQINGGNTPMPVHINLFAEQLASESMFMHISELLEKIPNLSSYLIFEIIENSMLDSSVAVLDSMARYKNMGFGFAIDDFGKGNANFDWLHNNHFDILKLDKEYISKITTKESSYNLLDKVIELGQSCGLTIVIEGVETKTQLNYLSKFDNILIQGYYASKPVKAQDYIHWYN